MHKQSTQATAERPRLTGKRSTHTTIVVEQGPEDEEAKARAKAEKVASQRRNCANEIAKRNMHIENTFTRILNA
jgi:hypothetical protein